MANPFAVNAHDQAVPTFNDPGQSSPVASAPVVPPTAAPVGGNPMMPTTDQGTQPTGQPAPSGGGSGNDAWWSYLPQGGLLGLLRSTQEKPIESKIMQEFQQNLKGGMPGTAAMMAAIQNHQEIFSDPNAAQNLVKMATGMTQKFSTADVAGPGGAHTLQRFGEYSAEPQYTESFPGAETDKGFVSQLDVQPGVNGQPGKMMLTPIGRVGPADEFQLTRAGLLVAINRENGASRVLADYRRGDTGQTSEEKNFLQMVHAGLDPNFAFDWANHLIQVKADPTTGMPMIFNIRLNKVVPADQNSIRALQALDQQLQVGSAGTTPTGADASTGASTNPAGNSKPMDILDAVMGGGTGLGQGLARVGGQLIGEVQKPNEPAVAGHAISAKEAEDTWKLNIEDALRPMQGSRMLKATWDYLMNQINDVSGFTVGPTVAIRRLAGLKDTITNRIQAQQQQLQSMTPGGTKAQTKAQAQSAQELTTAINAEQAALRTMQRIPTVAQLDQGWTPPGQAPGSTQLPGQTPQPAQPGQPQQQPQGMQPPPAVVQKLGVQPQMIKHGTFYGKSAWSADNGKTIVDDTGQQLNTGGQ